MGPRPPDLWNPSPTERVGGRLGRGGRHRVEPVVELAVELLFYVEADLVLARCRPRKPADAAIVAHQVPERRAAVGKVRARNVDFGVLVLVGEVEPELVLRER